MNNRLDDPAVQALVANQKFCNNNHAIAVLFNQYAAMCEHWRRPEDTFKLPVPEQLDGGAAIVELYRQLQTRERSSPQRGEEDPFVQQVARNYQNYVRDLNEFRRLLHYRLITPEEAAWCGLEAGDLDDIREREHGMIPIAAYSGPASRLNHALGKFQQLEDLPAEQRARIPHELSLRRLEASRRRLEEKEAQIEARLAALEVRTNNDQTKESAT